MTLSDLQPRVILLCSAIKNKRGPAKQPANIIRSKKQQAAADYYQAHKDDLKARALRRWREKNGKVEK